MADKEKKKWLHIMIISSFGKRAIVWKFSCKSEECLYSCKWQESKHQILKAGNFELKFEERSLFGDHDFDIDKFYFIYVFFWYCKSNAVTNSYQTIIRSMSNLLASQRLWINSKSHSRAEIYYLNCIVNWT